MENHKKLQAKSTVKKSSKYKKHHYMKIPMPLLNGLLESPKQVMNDWVLYALFDYAIEKSGEEAFQIDGYLDAINHFGLVKHKHKINLKYERAYQLHSSIDLNELTVGLKWSTFWQMYGRRHDEFDLVCLLAYLALKNIIYKKDCCKLNNKMLFSRMDGHRQPVSEDEINPFLRKYMNRYWAEKIRAVLADNWGLSFYGYKVRGFWASIKMSKENLVLKVEDMKRNPSSKKSDKEYRDEYIRSKRA